jgi:hypothetical protein
MELYQNGFILNKKSHTDKDEVEVQKSIDEVKVPRLGAVQVGSVGGEEVVLDDVECGEDRLAVVLK